MNAGDPALHLIVGPNGAGKSTLFRLVIEPVTAMRFVNADQIARVNWPTDAEARSYDAARIAERQRAELMATRTTFATETVFSHASKLDLIAAARRAGYVVVLHVVAVPEAVAVGRVAGRVEHGTGHRVDEGKIRSRYARLWSLVAKAIPHATSAFVYDNSRIDLPYRVVAIYRDGHLVENTPWPAWMPRELTTSTRRR